MTHSFPTRRSSDLCAPHLYLEPEQPLLLVSFGRSGNSPESLAAVELAESLVHDVRHLAIICNADGALGKAPVARSMRSEEHTSELQSLMRISYAVFCLKKKK